MTVKISKEPKFGFWTAVEDALPDLSKADEVAVVAVTKWSVRELRYVFPTYNQRNRKPRWETPDGRISDVPICWMPMPERPQEINAPKGEDDAAAGE